MYLLLVFTLKIDSGVSDGSTGHSQSWSSRLILCLGHAEYVLI